MQSLVDGNLALLDQLRELLAALDDEDYARPCPDVGLSGIGPHVRHCLDIYARLLDGLPGGRVDYDARERDPAVETDRRAALARLAGIAARLAALPVGAASPPDAPLAVRLDGHEATSRLRRELMALHGHTVHHFALIAVLLRALGATPPTGFGVAPSTLRFWQESNPVGP